ncbi:MAG: serine hydrolase, partial [Rubrobacteraceae bacterium]
MATIPPLMEGEDKRKSAKAARRLRMEQRARSRRRKAGAFIVFAAVAALLVGISAGGFLQGKSSQSKTSKNPKHDYASVLQPDVRSNRIKAPSTFPPTISNTTYQDIASQLPGLSRKDVGEAHQSVLDPSWASIRVRVPDREEGYYAVFLREKGKKWQPERSVLIDQNTYPKDPNAVLRDVPRDLAKTLEFPQQTSGSASKPADFAAKVIEQQTNEKGKWTAGKVRSSGDDYVVEVENKKDKSRHTNVYLTGRDGLYSVVAIGQDITSTEVPCFPKKLVKQEKASGMEKARFEPADAVAYGDIDQNSIKSGLKESQDIVEGYPGIAGFYAMDLKSGSGYGVRPNEEFFTASVIKVPVMIAVFRRIDEGKLSYKDLYKTKKEDSATGAGGLQWEPV